MPRGVKKVLTEVEKTKLQKALSDYSGASRFDIVNKDPDYHYFHAAKDPGHPQSVDAMKRLGYEIVNAEVNSGEAVPRGDIKTPEAGAIQNHEHVLMRLPKYLHEARLQKSHDLALERSVRNRQESEEALERLADAQERGNVVIFRQYTK